MPFLTYETRESRRELTLVQTDSDAIREVGELEVGLRCTWNLTKFSVSRQRLLGGPKGVV